MKGKRATTLIWIALLAACTAVFILFQPDKPDRVGTFGRFLEDVRNGRVAEVIVRGNEIAVYTFSPGGDYVTQGVIDGELMTLLGDSDVPVRWEEKSNSRLLLFWMLPVVFVIALVYFFFRRAKGTQMDFLSLGKSRARLVDRDEKITFQDVGGCAEAKQMLGDVVDFLRNPERWNQAGARLPRGVLLEGPPGCGKTLLARAVAGETNARFYMVSASEFVEMFVGVGAARVRDMFETAAKQPPAIVFIDELDAVGRRRGSGVGTGHDEREQTLNQILVCLDGFANHKAVVVLAATNRPDILDQALLRPGRFDRRIRVPALTRADRLEVLRVHLKNKPLADDVSVDGLADDTDGFNGAELENLANEAALLAVRRACRENDPAPRIRSDDFRQALRAAAAGDRTYNKLDAVLIESNTQLAEPTGKAVVRVTMVDGAAVEGEIVWADASFLKIRSLDDETDSVLAKSRIHQVQSLAGTEAAHRGEVKPDAWALRMPGMA
jgi:cell division protease FtsH